MHGGQHTKRCWIPTTEIINALRPDIAVLAVNLPGRDDQAGDLTTLTIEVAVASVLGQIKSQLESQLKQADGAKIILVAHSMAGITMPAVATALGENLVKRVVFLACCVPPDGQRIVDVLRPPVSWITRLMMRFQKVAPPMPALLAKSLFMNGATKQQKQFMLSCLCAESVLLPQQRVDRSAFPNIPSSWVLTLKDRALSARSQRQFIENLGGVDDCIELDTCHNAMISEPTKLANILLSYC